MVNIFISGNTYMLREEIKSLTPSSKRFSNKWRWIKNTKSWRLKSEDIFMTDNFKTLLEEFTKKHALTLMIIEISSPKSIKDYDSEEEYWEAFHKRNGQRYC